MNSLRFSIESPFVQKQTILAYGNGSLGKFPFKRVILRKRSVRNAKAPTKDLCTHRRWQLRKIVEGGAECMGPSLAFVPLRGPKDCVQDDKLSVVWMTVTSGRQAQDRFIHC